jgi:hypothetical protein
MRSATSSMRSGTGLQRLVEAEVAMDGALLLAQVDLPIEFIPGKIPVLFPLVFREVVRIEIAHLLGE